MKAHRRDFLKSALAVGAGTLIARDMLAQESPNEKVTFACVGIGGKGQSDSEDAKTFGQVVAFCDTNRNQLKGGARRFPGAKPFEDFREMFDKAGDTFDAFVVSTADHNHAAIAAMGMKMGKHIYCQKPLTRTISEARYLAELAKEKGLVTQMGNQGAAYTCMREIAAAVRAGLLGKVSQLYIWTDRPIWPQGGERGEPSPVPAYLNWECWLGVAPERPYVAGAYDPFAWRGWWDFGTGALGDMACHAFNVPYRALETKDPTSVQAITSGHNFDSFPKWSIIDFEFPANEWRDGFKLQWLDGGKRVDPELLEGEQPSESGFLIIGDEGKLYSKDNAADERVLLGKAKEREQEFLEKVRPNVRVADKGHFGEFVEAIKKNDPLFPASNFITVGSSMTETVLLGNLAVWAANEPEKPGQKIEWDAKNLKILGNPENREQLEKLVFPKYREGYTL